MELDPISIQQWLDKMPDDLHAPLQERLEGEQGTRGRAVTKATDHNIIDLVGDDEAPIITTAQNFKLWDVEDQLEPQDLMTAKDAPQRTSRRKASLNFERKPRPRTREDRYEYKGKNVETKAGSGDRVKKRRQRSRKHTLNDGFHAPNVPRERLTLHMNGGIFNKTKASCPLRLRSNVSVPASKSRPLLRENDNSEKSSLATKNATRSGTKGEKNRQTVLEYKFIDCAETTGDRISKTQHPNPAACSDGKENVRGPNDSELPEPKRHSLSLKHHQGHLDGDHLEEAPEQGAIIAMSKSKSPTPYTWSETDNDAPKNEDDNIETTVLRLLHAGLPLLDSELYETCSKEDPEKTYLSLEDLKDLLKTRRSVWPSESQEDQLNSESSPTLARQNRKRIMPAADTETMCRTGSSCAIHQHVTHQSKKARLCDPGRFEEAGQVMVLDRPPGDLASLKTGFDSRKGQNRCPANANEAKIGEHKHDAFPSVREEIQAAMQTNVQPAPPSTGAQNNWQLEVVDSDHVSPGRSLSDYMDYDEDFPFLLEDMVDQPDHYGQTSDRPASPLPPEKPQLNFLAKFAYESPNPAVHKVEDEVVPPGFWRRNQLY